MTVLKSETQGTLCELVTEITLWANGHITVFTLTMGQWSNHGLVSSLSFSHKISYFTSLFGKL